MLNNFYFSKIVPFMR